MGTGYTRNDTGNNIADGNVINASDIDGEFDAAAAAFVAATGHTHDGTADEGGPVGVLGPAQDYVGGASDFAPKTDDAYDLGSATNEWKDLFVDGTANIDTLVTTVAVNFAGATVSDLGTVTTADINGGTIDGVTLGTASAITEAQIDNININGNSITSTDAAGNIVITPHTTGDIVLDGLKWPQADGTGGQLLTTNGAGQLDWASASSLNLTAVDSDVISATDSTYDLGSTGVRWASAYIDDLILTNPLPVAQGGTASTSASSARSTLGLVIGTNVQAQDAGLQSISGLATLADRMIYTTASDVYAVATLTSFGRSLIDDANNTAARSTLGLGSMATQASSSVSISGGSITGITDLAVADGGTGSSTAPNARIALGLVIGTNVQAQDAELSALAGLTSASNKIPRFTGSGTADVIDFFDQDTMSSNSATAVASQQSIKAYVDTEISNVPAGMTLLATVDAAGEADIDFTAFNAGAYDAYRFIGSNVIPSTDNTSLYVRTSTDGGSTYFTGGADYAWAWQSLEMTSTPTPSDAGDDALGYIEIAAAIGSTAGEDGISFDLMLYGPHLVKETYISWIGTFRDNVGAHRSLTGSGVRRSAADVDGFRFSFLAGTIESGTISMYGITNS